VIFDDFLINFILGTDGCNESLDFYKFVQINVSVTMR